MNGLVPALVTCACALSWGGCSADANTPELVAALERARPNDAPPTRRVAKTPLPMEGASAHTVTERLELSLNLKNAPAQSLVLSMEASRGAWKKGARFHIHQRRSWTQGASLNNRPLMDERQGIFDGTRFATRRGHGAWREQEIWRGAHHNWLRGAYGLASTLITAYEPFMTLTRRETATVAGVRGEVMEVGFRTPPPPSSMTPDALRQLRDSDETWARWLTETHRATRVEGKLIRRAGGREVLSGRLKISGPVRVENTSGTFTLSWQRTVNDRPEDLSNRLTFPSGHVEPAQRQRPWLMVRSVLKSELADIYARRARP